MEKINPTFLVIVSDLFVNLSAGWLGAAFIIPATSKAPKDEALNIADINARVGIAFGLAVIAFLLTLLLLFK